MVMALLGLTWFMLAMWKWWTALRNPDPLFSWSADMFCMVFYR